MTHRILLVEDDPALGYVIKDNLLARGFEVAWVGDGELGIEAFRREPFDICVLDVMMPKKDGFSLAQGIREHNREVPILFITAKSMIEDKVTAFASGGDDYLVKPFSMEELCMRIDVFLRRSKVQSPEKSAHQLGEYTFDVANLTLIHPHGQKTLTQKETDVLKLLYLNRDRVMKREEILKNVWGDDDYFLGRSLDVFISKLRKYLKEDSSIEILNFHGVGFKLELKKT